MQQLTAILLRQAWKRRGSALCLHPTVEPEYDQAMLTGSTVCLTCGSYVEGPTPKRRTQAADRPA